MSGEFTKTVVVETIYELIEWLETYQSRIGLEVELIIRADGTATLMHAEALTAPGAATGFEEAARFERAEDLVEHLTEGMEV